MKAPLVSGAYQARSVISSAQRCVNLYGEKNEPDAPFPFTFYLTPGLKVLATIVADNVLTDQFGDPLLDEFGDELTDGDADPLQPSRCAYTASNGDFYEVLGQTVYYTPPNWIRIPLGQIATSGTPVSMADNGLAILLVDGSSNGYAIDLTTKRFAPVSGQNGAFYGGDRVDYVDTFFLLNRPGTAQWYISLSNVDFSNLTGTVSPTATAAAFDPLDIVSKTGHPDPIQALIVMHREVWLIGTQTTEVWYDAGASDFAFAELPGVFIEHGAVAKYSIAKQDLSVFWLSQDLQGQAIVLMGNQYAAKRISTHAIEQQIQQYSDVTDAIGFTYQQLGHTFYVLTFPSGDATWVYDVAEGLWHERTWTDEDGKEHRWRGNNCANAYGVNVAGDWETGALYQLDLNTFTDNGDPIVRRRGFPIMRQDNSRVEYTRLVLDMAVGDVPDTLVTQEPQVSLRYSDDGGKGWSNPRLGGIGAAGEYNRSVVFPRLGMGRRRVFEMFWDCPNFTALNGGDVTFIPCET